ncbi:MAG: transposase [Planctomycetaceae bacterium]|nr:transposase [Planctomycetaceae bacterium]
MVFHVLNRGVARMQIFEKAGDYQAFERVMEETLKEVPMRICAYCAMPSHWHMLCWLEKDGELATFMQRLAITHVRRWQEHRHHGGLGYVERNALRANLVVRAEEWRWSSLWRRDSGTAEEKAILAAWPVELPHDWLELVNRADNEQELDALRRSVQRGRPYGTTEWQERIAKLLGLQSAYRSPGRPSIARRNTGALEPR